MAVTAGIEATHAFCGGIRPTLQKLARRRQIDEPYSGSATTPGSAIEQKRLLISDDRRGWLAEPDGEHRHLRVRGRERPVTAAAAVMLAGEIDELPAGRSRHEHLAGVRVAQRRPRPGHARSFGYSSSTVRGPASTPASPGDQFAKTSRKSATPTEGSASSCIARARRDRRRRPSPRGWTPSTRAHLPRPAGRSARPWIGRGQSRR